jgi:hypothetical protein
MKKYIKKRIHEQFDFDFKNLIYKMKPGSIVCTKCEIPLNDKSGILILEKGTQCIVTRLVMGDVNIKTETRRGLWEIAPDNKNKKWMAYGDELEIIFMICEPKRVDHEMWYDDWLEHLGY